MLWVTPKTACSGGKVQILTVDYMRKRTEQRSAGLNNAYWSIPAIIVNTPAYTLSVSTSYYGSYEKKC